MKTITQIGNAALLRVFKPGLIPGQLASTMGGGLTPVRRRVDFPKKEIDLFKPFDKRGESLCGYPEGLVLSTEMAMWSIELGLIRFDVDDGETLLEAIIEIPEFKKRRLIPSHVVKIDDEDSDLGAEYVSIYRLSQKQEEEIRNCLK